MISEFFTSSGIGKKYLSWSPFQSQDLWYVHEDKDADSINGVTIKRKKKKEMELKESSFKS